MDEYESLNHTKWEFKYHVVFIPNSADAQKICHFAFDAFTLSCVTPTDLCTRTHPETVLIRSGIVEADYVLAKMNELRDKLLITP